MADHLLEAVDRAATVGLPAMLEQLLDTLGNDVELGDADELLIARAVSDSWLAGLHVGLLEGQARTIEAGAAVDLGLAYLGRLHIGAKLAGEDAELGDD